MKNLLTNLDDVEKEVHRTADKQRIEILRTNLDDVEKEAHK